MDQIRSTTVGALVIIGGVAAAMTFRKEPPKTTPETPAGQRRFAISVAENTPDGVESGVVLRDHRPASRPSTPVQPSGRLAEIRERTPSPPAIAEAESERPRFAPGAPPQIPQRYGGLVRQEPRRTAPTADQARLMTPQRRTAGRQQHRIRNRDTLESISQRYYGTPAYAGGIYEANRDQLPSTRILPLDVTLRLPQLHEVQRLSEQHGASETSTPSHVRQPEQRPKARTTLGSVR